MPTYTFADEGDGSHVVEAADDAEARQLAIQWMQASSACYRGEADAGRTTRAECHIYRGGLYDHGEHINTVTVAFPPSETEAAIAALAGEASARGDDAWVALCERALDGDKAAIRRCQAVIGADDAAA